jgi:hypothetical protein
MGIRSSAARTLELAFAAAYAQYFVGDPSFVNTAGGTPIFVSAQSVAKLTYPQVCFWCSEAVEQVALSAIYMGTLHVIIDSALNERADDYDSLLTLHDDRITKVVGLLSNLPALQGLINAPASGPDLRTAPNFQLYGIGLVLKEMNGKEGNRLSYILTVEAPFQPNTP